MDKQIKKGKFFSYIKYQLVNIEGTMVSLFCNHQSKYMFRQKSSINAKLSRRKRVNFMRNRIFT